MVHVIKGEEGFPPPPSPPRPNPIPPPNPPCPGPPRGKGRMRRMFFSRFRYSRTGNGLDAELQHWRSIGHYFAPYQRPPHPSGDPGGSRCPLRGFLELPHLPPRTPPNKGGTWGPPALAPSPHPQGPAPGGENPPFGGRPQLHYPRPPSAPAPASPLGLEKNKRWRRKRNRGG